MYKLVTPIQKLSHCFAEYPATVNNFSCTYLKVSARLNREQQWQGILQLLRFSPLNPYMKNITFSTKLGKKIHLFFCLHMLAL